MAFVVKAVAEIFLEEWQRNLTIPVRMPYPFLGR